MSKFMSEWKECDWSEWMSEGMNELSEWMIEWKNEEVSTKWVSAWMNE